MRLSIAEFAVAQPVTGSPLLSLPPLAEQVVELMSGAGVSAEFNGATNLIRLVADAPCAIAVGHEPAATWDSMQIVPGIAECFTVPTGHPLKLSAVLIHPTKQAAAARSRPATRKGRRK